MVSIDQFKEIEMVVAQIKEAREHPNADKLFVLKIDLGGEERQLVAGIRTSYKAEELIGKRIVVIKNLQPATIRGEESQGMLLAAGGSDGPVLLAPEKEVPLGSLIR